MKHWMLVAFLAGTLMLGLFGCDGGYSSSSPSSRDVSSKVGASATGVPEFYGGLKKCPVCGESPTRPEHHVDIKGGRVFFDRAECAEKFSENPDKYM